MLYALKRDSYDIFDKEFQTNGRFGCVDNLWIHAVFLFEPCWFGWREVANITISCPRPWSWLKNLQCLQCSWRPVYFHVPSDSLSIFGSLLQQRVNIGFDLYKERNFHAYNSLWFLICSIKVGNHVDYLCGDINLNVDSN